MEKLITIGSLLLSRRRLQHRRGRDGDWRGDSHIVLRLYGADDSRLVEKPCATQHMYNGIHNQDSPSDSNGRQLSGSSRRKLCYGPLMADLRSMALSVSTPQEIQVRLLCPHESGHAPGCTNNYNSWAQAGSESRTYLQSHHPSQSPHQRSRHWFAHCFVGCLKIYSSKVFHRLSSLYLFHMCSEISASSSRNHLGESTSMSLPIVRIS